MDAMEIVEDDRVKKIKSAVGSDFSDADIKGALAKSGDDVDGAIRCILDNLPVSVKRTSTGGSRVLHQVKQEPLEGSGESTGGNLVQTVRGKKITFDDFCRENNVKVMSMEEYEKTYGSCGALSGSDEKTKIKTEPVECESKDITGGDGNSDKGYEGKKSLVLMKPESDKKEVGSLLNAGITEGGVKSEMGNEVEKGFVSVEPKIEQKEVVPLVEPKIEKTEDWSAMANGESVNGSKPNSEADIKPDVAAIKVIEPEVELVTVAVTPKLPNLEKGSVK